MKQKLKKIFENAVWWSGVIMVGLVLGVSLQFVRAWTEPTEAPPNGNVGAPINTGIIAQAKQGVLQVLGLTVYNDPAVSGVDVTGKVLTAQNAYGATAWAAGGSSVCSGVPTQISERGGTSGVKLAQAAKACRDMGDCWHLPSFDEVEIFADPGLSDDWLWTTTNMGGGEGYQLIARLQDGAQQHEYFNATTSAGRNIGYRCVK